MKKIKGPDIIGNYLRHQEINDYLDSVRFHYRDVVKVCTIGRSFEGRLVKAIDIDWRRRNSYNPNARNTVFIEAGTHAREWMTTAAALRCIEQLTDKHVRHQELLDRLRFVIVPLSNPDGYEYSYYKNRMWRKNRRPHSSLKCVGTDCNRNYDFQWESGSAKAARNTFKGEAPFSEPETCALRDIMQKLKPNLLLFLSLHSYGQAIMYPWGYTRDLPDTWQNHQQLADCAKKAMKKFSGRVYRSGSIAGVRRRTYSGTIVDYVYGSLKVPFSLVVELPSNELGFQPLPMHIKPVGYESWVGIKAMCKKALEIPIPTNPASIDSEKTKKEKIEITDILSSLDPKSVFALKLTKSGRVIPAQ